LNKIAKENSDEVCQLSNEALEALLQYNFPGNVRELENILQRAATLCEDNAIQASNLEFISPPSSDPASESKNSDLGDGVEIGEGFSLEKHLESIEIEAIEKALEETRWNKTAAAKKLGMSFRSLRYRLKKLGLD
jgi:two-component system response regulator PilR (NtrC family)